METQATPYDMVTWAVRDMEFRAPVCMERSGLQMEGGSIKQGENYHSQSDTFWGEDILYTQAYLHESTTAITGVHIMCPLLQ